MKQKIFIILIISILVSSFASAQSVAIKTNLLYDATTSINLGIETRVAPRWSLDISGNYNPWNMPNNAKLKHLMVQPEARYWFCEVLNGHFFAIHLHGGAFNFGGIKNSINFLGTNYSRLTDHRFQGYFVGAGIGYGYSWMLSRHWNLEAEIGLGYSYVMYDVYECADCGKKVEEDKNHHYVGVTKAALNLVYAF